MARAPVDHSAHGGPWAEKPAQQNPVVGRLSENEPGNAPSEEPESRKGQNGLLNTFTLWLGEPSQLWPLPVFARFSWKTQRCNRNLKRYQSTHIITMASNIESTLRWTGLSIRIPENKPGSSASTWMIIFQIPWFANYESIWGYY